MDDPLSESYPPPITVEVIPPPGANRSRSVPLFVNDDKESVFVVEPTDVAFSEHAG